MLLISFFLFLFFFLSRIFVSVMVTVKGKLLRLCALTASMSAIWNWCSVLIQLSLVVKWLLNLEHLHMCSCTHTHNAQLQIWAVCTIDAPRSYRDAKFQLEIQWEYSYSCSDRELCSSFCVVKHQRHSHMFTVLDCDKNYNRHYSWSELRS